MKQREGRRAGFTLVEVLLTLLIMSGIMLTITQILNAARQSRDSIHNMQEGHIAGPAILDRLERDLRAIFTFNRDPEFHLRITNRVIAGYDADSIDFVCSTNGLMIEEQLRQDRYVRADANEVGYRLRLNPNLDDFMEIWRREDFGVDEEPFAGGNFAFLHDRVKGFDIQVYDEDGPEAEPLESWGTEDDEEVGLPARVEIELTIELAPRLVREALVPTYRTMTYRRVIRFPEMLREAQEVQPVPVIPRIVPPLPETDDGGLNQGFEPGSGDGGSGQGGDLLDPGSGG